MKMKMKIKDWIAIFFDGFFKIIIFIFLVIPICFFSFPRKRKKHKLILLQKDEVNFCSSCLQPLYLELDRKKLFVDDWDSQSRFCLNTDCKNYGKQLITVFDPLTFSPYTPEIKDGARAMLLKDDPRIRIIED